MIHCTSERTLSFFSNFFTLIATLVSFASETTGLDVKKKKENND